MHAEDVRSYCVLIDTHWGGLFTSQTVYRCGQVTHVIRTQSVCDPHIRTRSAHDLHGTIGKRSIHFDALREHRPNYTKMMAQRHKRPSRSTLPRQESSPLRLESISTYLRPPRIYPVHDGCVNTGGKLHSITTIARGNYLSSQLVEGKNSVILPAALVGGLKLVEILWHTNSNGKVNQ